MGPLGGLDAQLQSWDTLSSNSKRVLLVATQGHHLVVWLWLDTLSVNSSFVVSVVWRKKKVHKSHRQATNRSLALARSRCVFHILSCESSVSVFYVGQYRHGAIQTHRKTLTGEHIDNLQESLPTLLELGDIKFTPLCTVIIQMCDTITEPFWVK